MRIGISRYYTNHRGRWRMKIQVVDLYIDINLPYADTLVELILYDPKGSCRYMVSPQIDDSDYFLLDNVVPRCRRMLGDDTTLTIDHDVLWIAFEDNIILIPKAHRFSRVWRKRPWNLFNIRTKVCIIMKWTSQYGDYCFALIPGSSAHYSTRSRWQIRPKSTRDESTLYGRGATRIYGSYTSLSGLSSEVNLRV